MSNHHHISAWVSKITIASVLAFSAAGIAFAGQESTIFSFDGKDFVRTHTTVTKDGKAVVNTKLDRDSPGYKALIQKRSYTGEVTAFGLRCDGNYAPLTNKGGKLIGAIFVGICK